ncbi:MAG: type II toxin-antitoxin system VapC family toxin [Candidatus Geothermarchaeales archaeon]
MRIYLDTSALVKKYSPEKGSPLIKKIYARRDIELFTSEWAILEVIAAIDKKVTKRQISMEERDDALMIFLSDLRAQKISFVKFTSEFIRPASRLVVKHHISAADALHLFSAIASMSPTLLAADRALIKAAKREDIEAYYLEDQRDLERVEAKLKQSEENK